MKENMIFIAEMENVADEIDLALRELEAPGDEKAHENGRIILRQIQQYLLEPGTKAGIHPDMRRARFSLARMQAGLIRAFMLESGITAEEVELCEKRERKKGKLTISWTCRRRRPGLMERLIVWYKERR